MHEDDFIQRSLRVTPGGIHSQRRQTDPSLCITRASGSRVWDVNGTEYIDFHNAYGCIVLGHCDPRVQEAVTAALHQVDLVGLGVTPGEVELSERLVANIPSFDQVLLCNSGSEATLHAVRLARAVTGRRKVVKFQGAYHGTHDYLLSNDLALEISGAAGAADPPAGVFPEAAAATIVCRYNDLDSVRAVVSDHGDDIAAICVEPYAHNVGGAAPVPGFLEGLRELADAIGALLVFDEVITGIRHGLGGYQAVCGVTPDLSTLAKALANGLPIGAIGGRRRFMEHFNTSPSGDVLYSGTFNGGGAPVAAAIATLDALAEPGAYEHLNAMGERMRSGLAEIFAAEDLDATVSGIGSVFHIMLGPGGPVVSYEDISRNDAVLYAEYRRQMLARGILDSPELQSLRSYVSLSHTADDIDTALAAAENSIEAALSVVATGRTA